jgi:hypothetical protein
MKFFGQSFINASLALIISVNLSAQSPELRQFIQSVDKIPSDQAIDRALKSSFLTTEGSPFHAVLQISQPGDAGSPCTGTIEVYWAGPSRYRVNVASKTFSQTRIVNGTDVEERNIGDFYPAWIRNYELAILDPLPMAHDFVGRNAPVMLGQNISQSCVNRDDRTNGITDQTTWAQICFQGQEPRIKYAMDFTYFMEFGDYKSFGKKLVARSYTTYTDGNEKVIGQLKELEPLNSNDDNLFQVSNPTPVTQQIQTVFVSMAANQSLLENVPTIDWPPVHEGKTEGNMIVHVITDRTGQVREAYKHNSDNAGTEAFGTQQALKYKFKPLMVNGVAVQMETPLVLHFSTKIGDPIPVLTGGDIKKYAPGCGYNPVLPKGLLPSGTTFKIRVSVNERGEDTGETFPQDIPWSVVQRAHIDPRSCHFKPYLINGQPWYHHIDFVFTAP